MTPDLLLLDLDGLIRHWRDTGAREGERLAGLPPRAFEAAYKLPEYQLAQLGVLTDQQWADVVCGHLTSRYGPAAARRAMTPWRADRGEIDRHMLALVQTARVHLPVAILSNTTSALEADLRLHGIADAFDAVFSSAILGAAKPAPAVYRAVTSTMGVHPERVFFTDDEMIHVYGARHAGLQTEVFTNAATFAAALTRCGLPCASAAADAA
jgi:putative hydrolase of the HAD superfamily